MKKLIFLCMLLLSSCIPVPAQHPSAIMASFQPADLGIGIKYEHAFDGVGMYGSVSYGNWGLYKEYEFNRHVKSTIGIMMPMRDYLGYNYDFTAGINYHYIHSCGELSTVLDSKVFNPWSFELGISLKLKRLAIAVRTDILRWEPCVDVGLPIRYK